VDGIDLAQVRVQQPNSVKAVMSFRVMTTNNTVSGYRRFGGIHPTVFRAETLEITYIKEKTL
jgi:hypothetical protein